MEMLGEPTGTWKNIKSIDDAKNLVDLGVLLSWADVRQLKKVLSQEDCKELTCYFAIRLAERVDSRFPEEILIESLLIFLTNNHEEEVLNAFLEELVEQPNALGACRILVELAITIDISDSEHYGEIFSFAVALICELGRLIEGEGVRLNEDGLDTSKILAHISTYLLSVSNSSDMCVRLSLVHYFGATEGGSVQKPGFNRIMSRFGHTVLEHLFTLLFNKKTEAVALQFLLENTPFILEADNHCQKILHETWKFYMLKKPERFSLFIQALTNHIAALPEAKAEIARRVYLQHLGVLLKVASDVNHKDLGREILCALGAFSNDPFRNTLVTSLSEDKNLRQNFRNLMFKLIDGQSAEQVLDKEGSFKSSKRGRRPSFARVDNAKPIFQATYLGNQSVAKAS